MLTLVVFFLFLIEKAYAENIAIEGRFLEGNLTSDLIFLQGPIKIKGMNFAFQADKALIRFYESLGRGGFNKIKELELFGSPAKGHFNNKKIFCKKVTIDMQKKQMLLDEAQVMEGQYQIKAARVLYNFSNKQFEIAGSQDNLINLNLNVNQKD